MNGQPDILRRFVAVTQEYESHDLDLQAMADEVYIYRGERLIGTCWSVESLECWLAGYEYRGREKT